MSKKSGATMNDIAAHVGVSRTAVSFVLNGSAREKGISRQMEARILQAAKQLNYRPSMIARSLVTNKSMTIGLVLPSMGVTYGPLLAETIEVCALDQGYQVLLCHHGGDQHRLRAIIQMLTSRRVDGLIIVPPVQIRSTELYQELLDQQTPIVFVERDPDDRRISFVSTDAAVSLQMAVEHLIDLGHQRIAFLNAAPELLASRLREQAYRQTMDAANLAVDPQLLLTSPSTAFSVVADQMDQLLALRPRPTGIVAVSAERAMAVYVAAEEHGIGIPQDLSVIVISGYEFSPFHKTRFTQVRLPYEAVGEAAIRILLNDMQRKGKWARQRALIEPELIPGETTAPPNTPA